MKTKTIALLLTGLLLSMIGAAWSQNSNTSKGGSTVTNKATGGRGRDVGPANKDPYKWKTDINAEWNPSGVNGNGMVYHPEYANSSNAWYPADNGNFEANPAANLANYPSRANTAAPPRKKKPRRTKKPRRISGTPTVSKFLSVALAGAFDH